MGAVADVNPPTRKARAAATRRRIVECAHELFIEDGYAATTMPAVAAAAGVAVQTVYLVFRTKGDLLQAVYELAVLGPEGLPPHLMVWWPSIDDGYDVEQSIQRFVEGTMELLARVAPLVWTVLGDETARAGYEHNEGLRRVGYGDLVSVLAEKHPLRPGRTPTHARDVLLVLTGPQLFVQYTRDLGWSHSELAEWIITAALDQLFGIRQ